MSALHKTVLKSKLPPRPPKSSSSFKQMQSNMRKKDYTPVSWKQYYYECKDIEIEGGTFRVYLSDPPDEPDRPRLIVLHGGGYSGLSWSQFTVEVTKMIQCQVVAIDFRGHGNTFTDNNDDLSENTLTKDIVSVLEKLFAEEKPPIVLIGHSMGGAIAVRVANCNTSLTILGLAVIDVVEGTAMESLSSMQSFLRGRPNSFKSIENAIEWCVRSGQTRNTDSAKVSMPGQIMNSKDGILASAELENYESPDSEDSNSFGPPAKRLAGVVLSDSIAEEAQEDDIAMDNIPTFKPSSLTSSTKEDSKNYVWRIDLSRTERYWTGWFQGLSTAFLECTAPKLLLLASISGLDRELTVGQMQGKFQMQVLTRCGHAVHEDCPEEVAQVIASFMLRHKFTDPASQEQQSYNVMPGC